MPEVYKIAAEDPRGHVNEEDRKGKIYHTKRFLGINHNLEYVGILSYKNHHLLEVGKTVTFSHFNYRYNRLIVNGNTQLVKGYITRNIPESMFSTAEFKVQQPNNPYVTEAEFSTLEPDSFCSIRGVVVTVGDIRKWFDQKEKSSQDIFIRLGKTDVQVTLWNQCTYRRIDVGDIVAVQDSKLKISQYQDRTIWCSLNDNLWIEKQKEGEWKEYDFVGFDDENVERPNTVKLMLDQKDYVVTATVTYAVLKEHYNFSENNKEIFFMDMFGRKVNAIITENEIVKIVPANKFSLETLKANGADKQGEKSGLKRKANVDETDAGSPSKAVRS